MDPIQILDFKMNKSTSVNALHRSAVHVQIGEAELDPALPTTSEANRHLYELIDEKKKKLAEIREKVDAFVTQNTEKRREIVKLRARLELIKEKNSLQHNYLTAQRQLLNGDESALRQIAGESAVLRQKISASARRTAEIRETIDKQTDALASLNRKLSDRTRRKAAIDRKMDATDFICGSLEEAFRKDQRTIKELEVYLRKQIRQVYQYQRDLDLMKLGQLDSKAEAEGIRRLVMETERRQSTIALTDRNDDDRKDAEDDMTAIRTAEEHERQRIERWIVEYRQCEIAFVDAIESELKEKIEITEIDEANNRLKAELDLWKKLVKSKRQSNETEINSVEVDDANKDEKTVTVVPTVIERPNTSTIDRLQERVDQLKANAFDIIRRMRADPNWHRSKMKKLGESSSEGSSDGGQDLSPAKQQRQKQIDKQNGSEDEESSELNKMREKIFDECMSSIMEDMRDRCTKLRAEVALLDGQVKVSCAELELMRTSIQRETDKTAEMRRRMALIHEHLVRRKGENAVKYSKQRTTRANEEQELAQKITVLRDSLDGLEVQRNRLNAEIIQAQVDENNLRNRHAIYESKRNVAKNSNLNMKRLRGSVAEWRERVAKAHADVESLERFLRSADQRNRATRRQFAALRSASQPTAAGPR